MTECERDEQLEEIVRMIIEEEDDFEDLVTSGARIAVVRDHKDKKSEERFVFADIQPVKNEYRPLIPFDYLITVHKAFDLFAPKGERICLEHELRHAIVKVGRNGFEFKTRGHDFEDFYAIIDKYGLHWQQEMMKDA